MSDSADYARLLNIIIANLPLIDKADLTALARIIENLEGITRNDKASKALTIQAKRALALANHIAIGEIDFDKGCRKLTECLMRMHQSINHSPPRTETIKNVSSQREPFSSAAIEHDNDISITENALPDDIRELIIKFASSQQTVLEDFESYILEFEKSNPHAEAAIKRILHTLKGEFGVLNLNQYAKLIHRVEELIEQKTFTTDCFFKLKDLLAEKLAYLAGGISTSLTKADIENICPESSTISPPDTTAGKAPGAGQSSTQSPASSKQGEHTTTINIQSSDPSLISDFITESRDHLHTAETLLLDLETDLENKETLNSIFRSWHTIKGLSGFLGIREINTLAHKMENQMDRVRKGDLAVGPGPIDAFLEANDCLKSLVVAVENVIKGDEFVLPEKLDAITTRLVNDFSPGDTVFQITSSAGNKKIGELLVEAGKAAPEIVDHALEVQAGGDSRKIGEILLDEPGISARDLGNMLAAQTISRQASTIEETIRVPINRIDQLVDSIGEAVIAQSMVNANVTILNAADQELVTKIAHANSIFRQIQELAMSLRMISIKSTFQKMARLVRDLSKKCGRDIEFVTEGEETELDKSIVENISDPLIHMIRNSIDHGIEAPDERERTGKQRKALIKLRAFHRAGSIFIEVIDDGRGLDRNSILKKAIEKGLCTTNANLSDQEIFQFIFLPGFSTAKTVTDISGRGVGMDVVRRNIETLRGSIEIFSSPGTGTTFSIRLPLTLAIVDGMVVRSGTERYIIPTLAILESIKANHDLISSVFMKGRLIKVRNELIPLVHLGSLLGQYCDSWDIANGIVVIVEDMLGKKIGLFLDEIIGQQQVVIKNLGDGIGDIPGVTGGAIMSDGTISLILDIGGVVKLSGDDHWPEPVGAVPLVPVPGAVCSADR